jgi:molybdopterin-guanine dinucleotide biosynthesis protein A
MNPDPSRFSRFEDVAGVILAGGQSRRYGSNKALVQVNGITLIEKVTEVMGLLFEEQVIITNTPDEYAHLRLPMHEDLIKGLGPLGGIHTALTLLKKEAGFFVACDMPSLNAELIRHMVGIRDAYDAVVPIIKGKLEALHSLYHKRCLPAVERLIESGELQVFRFFHQVSVRYVNEDEIRVFDPGLRSFFNVNRPQELRHYKMKRRGRMQND